MGASLLARGLQRARLIDPGFDTGVLVVDLNLRSHGYDETRARQLHQQLAARLLEARAETSVSMASLAPLGGINRRGPLVVDGSAPDSRDGVPSIDYLVVSPSYFETLGVPIVLGRGLKSEDTRPGTTVAVVNEAMARQFWPGQSALGRHLRLGPPTGPFLEVVGVARGHRGARLWEDDRPYLYLPLLRSSDGPAIQTGQLGMSMLVRMAGDPSLAKTIVLRSVRALDPDLSPAVVAIAESMQRWIWFSQIGAMLSGAMGLLALLLTAVGTYGVTSYSVSQRTHEIGIRMAVGASRSDVVRLVLARGAAQVSVAAAIGLLGSLGVSYVLSGFLYGISPLSTRRRWDWPAPSWWASPWRPTTSRREERPPPPPRSPSGRSSRSWARFYGSQVQANRQVGQAHATQVSLPPCCS